MFTARHCLAEIVDGHLAKGEAVYVVSSDGQQLITPDAARNLYAAPFSSQSTSFQSDFVVFSILDLGSPLPVLGISGRLAKASVGQKVVINRGDGKHAGCVIRDVCGSSFFYSCSPATVEGWSGSPVMTRGADAQLLGIHSAAAPIRGVRGEKISQGVSSQTILGRSSGLFGTSEEFGNEIARSRKYAHSWSGGCSKLAPAVRAGSPLSSRVVEREALFTAMVALSPKELLSASIKYKNAEFCLLTANSNWTKWRCTPNKTPFAGRINTLASLSDARIAIGEALLPPRFRTTAMTQDDVAGGVSVGRILISNETPKLQIEHRVSIQLGSVYAIQAVSGGLLVGAENGACFLGNDDKQCTPICLSSPCTKSDEWRVNGLVLISDDLVVAVGRDMQEGRAYPTAKWLRRFGSNWRQTAGLDSRASLIKLAERVPNRRAGMQFKAPVRLGTDIVVFGSDGAGYRIFPGKVPIKIPIQRLWKIETPDTRRDEVEDAVRDAIVLKNGLLAIAASDGAVHILAPRSESVLRLEGDQNLSVFDRGIWATELAELDGALFARTQDGNIHYIDLTALNNQMNQMLK
ncbi:hypothetical protein NZL82_13015 [Sphingomonas sanguinis]|nr:hypothetical protein [Sphingomonas sp. LC-1]